MKTFNTLKDYRTELQKFCEHHQFDTDKYNEHCYVNQYYGYAALDCDDLGDWDAHLNAYFETFEELKKTRSSSGPSSPRPVMVRAECDY